VVKSRARTAAAVLAGYVIVGAVMLAPITNYRHLASATYGSDTRLTVWILAWTNHVTLDGGSLFDANVFFPSRNALAYAEHLLSISVFTLPTYALTRNPDLAYNIAWLLSYLTCALAAHALAWRITRDHLASFAGGVAYAFCFYRMLHGHAHIQLLWACWIPLSFLLLERWWRQPAWSNMALLWLVVLMQVLASWYLAIMVLVADALLALYLALRLRVPRRSARLMLIQIAAGGIAGAAIVWPIARHYMFLAALNGDSRAEAATYAARVSDLVVPPLNTWLGQWLVRRGSTAPKWIWGENTLFLGYVTMALAAIGLLRIRRPQHVAVERRGSADDRRVALGFFAVLGAIALVLAFGPSPRAVAAGSFDPSPFGLFSMLPAMSLFRVPARFVQLTTLALAVLAAAGAETLHARFAWRGRALTILLLPLMLGEWYLVDFPGGAPQPERIPAVYRQLATLPAHAVVSLPDYIGGPEWFLESDYQFYSTAHWHPIVNGYARTEPPGYRDRITRIATFPSRDCAEAMRAIGADYIVFHAARYPAGATERIEHAKSSSDFALVAQSGSDYLYHVR
jgi:hypothetical protein